MDKIFGYRISFFQLPNLNPLLHMRTSNRYSVALSADPAGNNTNFYLLYCLTKQVLEETFLQYCQSLSGECTVHTVHTVHSLRHQLCHKDNTTHQLAGNFDK